MIKSNSPYYVETDWVNPLGGSVLGESYTISIRVWNGLKASVPATAEYDITKANPTSSTGTDKINISRLINDFIEFTPQSTTGTSVIDANNQWWVKTQVIYENDATVQQETTSLYSLGFSYGNEGENVTTIINNTLLSSSTAQYRTERNSVFTVPILVDESSTVDVSVISFPDSEISLSTTIAATTDSRKLVRLIWINVLGTTTDKYIQVTRTDGITSTQIATIIIKDEYKYTPVDIVFQNKEGGQETITFFKEKIDRLNVTKETYESDSGQPGDGNHQFRDYNVQARSGFSINSGFVHESYNEVFNELMLSKRIWIYENNTFTPINLKTGNIEYKTRNRNRLINYVTEFEYSYNEVNNI